MFGEIISAQNCLFLQSPLVRWPNWVQDITSKLSFPFSRYGVPKTSWATSEDVFDRWNLFSQSINKQSSLPLSTGWLKKGLFKRVSTNVKIVLNTGLGVRNKL